MFSKMYFIVTLLAIVFSIGAFACSSGGDEAEGYSPDESDLVFINAVPSPESLELSIPEKAQESTAKFTHKKAKLGETAEYYLVSRKTMKDLNGGVYYILSVIEEIMEMPPTSSSDSERVWQAEGPLMALDPTVPRFTVKKKSADEEKFSFKLEWRPKDSSDGWQKIWWGEMQADPHEARLGEGKIIIDFDTAYEMDPLVTERGQLNMDFDTRVGHGRNIEMRLHDLESTDDKDNYGPASGTYDFFEDEDKNGSFDYEINSNFVVVSDEMETLKIKTSWNSDGSGQSHVEVSGENFGSQSEGLETIEVQECWDNSFLSSYYIEYFHFDEEITGDLADNPVANDEQGEPESCPFDFD